MSQDPNSEQPADIPKWIPAGSAVLGAFFFICAWGFGVFLIAVMFQWGEAGVQPADYRSLVMSLVGAVIVGGGLRWVAQQYRSPTVQAGALVGSGIMLATVVGLTGFSPGVELDRFILVILVGLGVFVIVFPLSANPSPDPDERTGGEIVWRGFRDRLRRPRTEELSDSERTDGSTSHSASTATVSPSRVDRNLPVSQYWLVVGSAFAVSIPIAFFKPDVGIGLLSAFLTAYALSHRLKHESKNGNNEE